MDNFQLSPELDKNKIFLVNRSELEGRLDPFFNSLNKQDKSGKYSFYELKIIANIKKGDSITSDKVAYGHIPVIAGGQTSPYSHNIANSSGDVITVSASGAYAGYVWYHNNPIFASDCTIISSKNKKILNNKFLFEYLKSEQQSIYDLQQGSGQPHVYPSDLKKIKIPIPPLEIQTQIVEKMDTAYTAKKQKEDEARQLLASIDEYLLGELGIEMPKQTDNTLQSRIFTRRLSEVTNRRLDPDYYQGHFKRLQYSLNSGYYKCSTINAVTDRITNGNTPASNDYSDVQTDYPIIKVKSYKGAFISLEKQDFTNIKKVQQANKNDIFVLAAAHQASYVGHFVKYLDGEPMKNTSFVGELICIRANNEMCNPMYLFSLLNMKIYKILMNREKTGQTSHIYPKDIKNIKIPLPPLPKQTEIANHITKIRNRAKQLQQQAKAELQRAKRVVEAMILGKDVGKT